MKRHRFVPTLRVGAAAALLATAGCGRSTGGAESAGIADGDVPPSPAAQEVVKEVRSRLVLVHREQPEEHKSLWEEIQEELSRKDQPALRDTPIRGYTRRDDGRLAPVVKSEKARVSLAAHAHAPTKIASVVAPVEVEVTLRGARPQPAEIADGYVVYRDAMGPGAHVFQRATEDGAEDYVLFPARPKAEELVYTVDVTRTAGVRVVEGSNAVELLSEDGYPRLHMAPPRLVDARGETLLARTEVTGCAFDTDPHEPWGRPVTPAGSGSCEVRVSWDGVGAVYPVLIDPAWTQTGVPLVARAWHQMVLLDSGSAMSFGGYGPGWSVLASVELWNNGVWAAGASMSVGRGAFQARKLDDGDVIAIGGGTTTSRWSKASATWVVDANSATKVNHGTYFGMAKLQNGKLLAVSISNGGGAASKDAELYDPATRTWTVVTNMNHARGFLQNQVLGLPDGRAFVIGGSGPDGGVTELYDPVTNTWTDGPTLVQGGGRGLGVALQLANGRIFMSGTVRTVETLDLGQPNPAWKVSTPSPQTAVHAEHTAIQLLNGRVLLHGSYQAAKPESQTWDPLYDLWKIEAGITKVSDFPAAVRFADARVLVTGGSAVVDDPSNNSPIAWLFGCTSDADCGGTIPFCELVSGKCRPCLSDNGSGGAQACQNPAYPFCEPSGACSECQLNDTSHCAPGTPACDVNFHNCVTCSGNHGSSSWAPCPDPLHPYCNLSNGLCDAACTSDTQCAATEFCDDLTPTGACRAKAGNGLAVPGGACTATVAARACASGACDAQSLVCGLDLGHGVCATSAQCNQGVCVTSGANLGRCEPCDQDGDCAAGKVCDAQNLCVQCAAGKTGSCGGATPVCDLAAETCVGCLSSADCATASKPVCDVPAKACAPCNADFGQPGLGCASGAPFCSSAGTCGQCATAADCQTGNHPGPICNPATGACGTKCTTDADCPGKWCDNPSAAPGGGTCAALVPNGQPVPSSAPIGGLCTAAVGARVCASGVCDPGTNGCGLANGSGPCTVADGPAVCLSAVCDPQDGKCGLADGGGPCTPATGATVCRSGFCTASGFCEPTGGCATDGDCGAAQFCDTQASACAAKLANGDALPSLGGHTPPLTGACSPDVAAAVCLSAVCDPGDDRCGYANGAGPCTVADAATVCRSGVCDGGLCGYVDGHGPCSSGAQCQSGICGPSGVCGAPPDAGPGGAGGATGSGGATTGSTTTSSATPTATGGAPASGGAGPGGSAPTPGAAAGCGCVTAGGDEDGRTLAGVVGALVLLGARRRRRRLG